MKKYKVFIVLLIVTIIYLTVNVSSAFVINEPDKTVPAYKNKNLLRLHVIANSNSPYDQYIKRYIRDEVIKKMSDYKNKNVINSEKISKVKNYINKKLQENNINYTAEVSFGNYTFPMRSYGKLTLPAGKYRAVRIVLGTGKGSNWWCVLLPPLCLPEKENTNSKSENNNIKFKFKIAEVLNDNSFDFADLKRKSSKVKTGKLFDLTGTYIY